ncbi:MOLPALP family lipoprotein [Mesoplasma seiffertii]|uniref:MOLPALP family lipoprotein n=1 Tax=Mesoplasma seiffertii TaxID=28224 RepID=UPI00047A59A7|nr:MOLPALP family lipoprotein [Mesoplasma seiffertii]
MRKLLCILGALTIVASSSATIVSCGTVPNNIGYSETVNNETNLKLVTAEIAKTLILNDQTGIDANYMFDNFTSGQRLNSIEGFDLTEPTMTQYTRLNEWTKNYFSSPSVFNKQTIKTNANLTVRKQVVSNGQGILETIAGLGDAIKLLTKGNALEAIVGIISNSVILQAFISTDLADFIKTLNLPIAAIDQLAYAFDDLAYDGYSYQEVVNASSIELSNGLRNILGFENLAEVTVDNDINNFNQATDNIGQMLGSLIGQKAEVNVNMFNSARGLAQVIRFGRGLLSYMMQFDQYRSYQPQDGKKLFSSSQNNNKVVDEVLKKQFVKNETQNDNNIDFKKLMVNITSIFTVDEQGYNFQKLMAMFFAKTPGLIPSSKSGLAPLVNQILKSVVEANVPNGKLIGAFIPTLSGSIFDALANRGTLDGLISAITLASIGFSEELKVIAKQVTSALSASKLNKNFYGELYNGDVMHELGPVLAPLGINLGTSTGFNIKAMLSTPIIDNQSISGLLNNICEELELDVHTVVEDGKYSEQPIVLSKISTVIRSLTNQVTWREQVNGQINVVTTSVLERALRNPYEMFEVLGYNNKTGKFNKDSPLAAIKDMLGDGVAIAEMLKVLKVFSHATDTSINQEIAKIIQTQLMDPTKWTISSYNKKQSGKIIKELSVKVAYQSDQYELKIVRQKTGYFKVDTFTKLSK